MNSNACKPFFKEGKRALLLTNDNKRTYERRIKP